MDVVGLFLHHLFDISDREVPECILTQRCDPNLRHITRAAFKVGMTHLQERDSPHVLHRAPKYNQNQLIRLVIGIYGGPPQAFQLLRCHSTTSEQDLRLFIKRILKHPGHQYVCLEVNCLPHQLQEVLCAKFSYK